MSDQMTLEELRNRIDGLDTAMLTTIDERGTLSARPMTIQDVDDEGHVLFAVSAAADWVVPGEHPANVAVTGDGIWVSITGHLTFTDDEDLLEKVWDAKLEAWFPDGKDSARIAHLAADRWEYWSSPSTAAVAFEVAKAYVTGGTPDVGGSGSIEV